MPHGCKYIGYRSFPKGLVDKFKHVAILCENHFDNRVMKEFEKLWSSCSSLRRSSLDLVIKPAYKRNIVGELLEVFRLPNFISTKLEASFGLEFLSVDGFHIESNISLNTIKSLKFYTNFDLFKNDLADSSRTVLVKNCLDFKESQNQEFIFKSQNEIDFIIFKQKASFPVCSLFFRKAKIKRFELNKMVDSYFLTNTVSFTDPIENDSTEDSLNSTITEFYVANSLGLKLDAKLLNPNIFRQTIAFSFHFDIEWIDASVFKNLSMLREIRFDSANLMQLMRRQGIEWIKSINSEVKVNLSTLKRDELSKTIHQTVGIVMDDEMGSTTNQLALLDDQDFCIFAEFPFDQLVFLYKSSKSHINHQNTSSVQSHFLHISSCTEIWLYQFLGLHLASEDFLDSITLKNGYLNSLFDFEACKFEQRLNKCNKSSFVKLINRQKKEISAIDFILFIDFVLLTLENLLALIVILSNLQTFYLIYRELYKNKLKHHVRRFYIFMTYHCVFNALIGFNQILRLMSECGKSRV